MRQLSIRGRRIGALAASLLVLGTSFVMVGIASALGIDWLATTFAFVFIFGGLMSVVLLAAWLLRQLERTSDAAHAALRARADQRAVEAAERRRPTPYRFNPPPGWPEPAPDWIPAPGWEPERSWPEMPQGWQLWQRTVPRPLPPTRTSPWEPDPAAGRLSPETDPDKIRQQLSTPEGRRRLGIAFMQFQTMALKQLARFEAEHKASAGGPFRRSRWHPLEWSYRHAAAATAQYAETLADELVGDPDADGRAKELDAEDVATRWQLTYVWLNEMIDALAERAGTNRNALPPTEASSTDVLDPGPAGWQQAEQLAASALQQFGFGDAQVTGSGTDRGLDVSGRNIAGQVKYTNAAIGRPIIQQLVGASGGRQTAFFSRSGYTDHAIEEADRNGMALFRIALPRKITAVNQIARQMSGQ